jgi:serine/threonine protein kinase
MVTTNSWVIPDENVASSLSCVTAVLLSRNTAFADFKLRGHRGSGGFSDVYEAIGKDNKRVAIKVLRVPGGANATNLERFERELRILQRMDNRRIARLVAAKLDSDPPWIASEYIDGPNLREAIKEKGNFALLEATSLFSLVAKTLADLHSEGIAHRDLTPNNILLGEFGPVIIDFGSAKEDLTADAGSVLSVGTPDFAAPEVLTGAVSGLASDVYSLARIFLFLIGIENVESSEFENLSMSTSQKQKIKDCLSKEPKIRPNANDLANLFETTNLTKELTNQAYSQIVISKLPRRVSILTLAATAAAVGLIAVAVTILLVGGNAKELTPQRIIALLDESSPSVQIESIDSASGWLRKIPSLMGFPAEYQRPVGTLLESSVETVEVFTSVDPETANMIQTSASVISADSATQLISEASGKSGEFDLGDVPLLEREFKITLTEFIDKALPANCELLQSKKIQIVDNTGFLHLRIAAGAKNCIHQSGESFLGFILMDVYPNENAIVTTQVVVHGITVSFSDVVNGFETAAEPLVRSATNKLQDVFPPIALLGNELEINDQSRYQKIAYRLPAGSALKIRSNSGSDTKLSGVAIPQLSDSSIDESAYRYISLGAIDVFSEGEIFTFNNPTANDWIAIFEFDERGEQGLDFEIGISEGAAINSNINVLSDFQSIGKAFEETEYPYKSIDFPFILPIRSGQKPFSGDGLKTIDISSVDLPVPDGWYTESVPQPNAVVLNANPTSPYLDFLESDSARLDVQLDAASRLFTKKETYPWYALDDYEFCNGYQEFEIRIQAIVFAWKVFNGCLISDALSSGDQIKQRLQVTPIVKFVIVRELDEDGDGLIDYWLGAIRGEFVPQTSADLDYWDYFVKSINSQILRSAN